MAAVCLCRFLMRPTPPGRGGLSSSRLQKSEATRSANTGAFCSSRWPRCPHRFLKHAPDFPLNDFFMCRFSLWNQSAMTRKSSQRTSRLGASQQDAYKPPIAWDLWLSCAFLSSKLNLGVRIMQIAMLRRPCRTSSSGSSVTNPATCP